MKLSKQENGLILYDCLLYDYTMRDEPCKGFISMQLWAKSTEDLHIKIVKAFPLRDEVREGAGFKEGEEVNIYGGTSMQLLQATPKGVSKLSPDESSPESVVRNIIHELEKRGGAGA